MGLFSEMIDAERIKSTFRGGKNVLMITCPGCACESVSYTEDWPCRALEQGKDMEHSALAIHRMRDKWDEILRDMGLTVSHITIAFPCEMFDTDRAQIMEAISGCDTVGVLCCGSGCVAIRDMLDALDIRIVPMMKTSGTFVIRLVKDETGLNSKVDRESARIVRFSKKQ